MNESALLLAYAGGTGRPRLVRDFCRWDAREIVAGDGSDTAVAAAVHRHQATPEHRGARVRMTWAGALVAPEPR